MPVMGQSVLLCLMGLLLGGCGGESAKSDGATESSEAPGQDALVFEVERGPVRVAMELSPRQPRLSDEPTFTLTVDAEEAVDVSLPPFGDSIGGLRVRDFHEPLPELANGRRIVRQVYRLEPTASGEHVIRPFAIRFVDHRPTGDGQEHLVETEPLTVEVTSLFGDDAPDLSALQPATTPESVDIPATYPVGWIIGGLVALCLAAVLLLRRKRVRVAAEPERTPVQKALAEFEALVQDDPLTRGDMAGFYVELTAIVRRYIERTTGLRAPEQTTEEFLRSMRSHESFQADRRERLKSFLESSDLVKFAALRPERSDVDESFRRAQEFCDLPGALSLHVAEREAVGA